MSQQFVKSSTLSIFLFCCRFVYVFSCTVENTVVILNTQRKWKSLYTTQPEGHRLSVMQRVAGAVLGFLENLMRKEAQKNNSKVMDVGSRTKGWRKFVLLA